MIKLAFLKILRFFYRLLSKLIYLLIPFISRLFVLLRINSRIINQLNKLRLKSHDIDNHYNLISKFLDGVKLTALDVGAQGGFFNANMFKKEYNDFFTPILVEPIVDEAEKLIKLGYQVINKGIWSKNCYKKLYILGKRPGSTSMHKPSKDNYDLYNLKDKNFSQFEITRETEVECTTLKESLNDKDIKELDFLKIDTQGSELEILKGIGEYYPLLMKVEVQIVPLYENIPDWSELINHLHKLNYMTCEWTEIGPHVTRSPVEMDMLFIPNYLNDNGKKIILSKQKKFTSLMIIFGQIKLLQVISKKLNFSDNFEIQKIKDKFFH